MKTKVVSLVLAISMSGQTIASEFCTVDANENVTEFAEDSCSVVSNVIFNKLNTPDDEFKKVYDGKSYKTYNHDKRENYQDRIIRKTASIEATAQKSNYKLWSNALGSELFRLRTSTNPADQKRLRDLIKATYPKKNDSQVTAYVQSISQQSVDDVTRYNQDDYHEFLDTIEKNPTLFAEQKINMHTSVEKALKAVPGYNFQAGDLDRSYKDSLLIADLKTTQEQDKETDWKDKLDPTESKYWEKSYQADNPFVEKDTDSYGVNYQAYIDFKQKLEDKYQAKLAKHNYTGKDLEREQKRHEKEMDTIEFLDPKKINIAPPDGVNIEEFYQKVKSENPSYFNCRVSYASNPELIKNYEKNWAELPPDPKVKKEGEEVDSPKPRIPKTCDLKSSFGDNGYEIQNDSSMASEIKTCFDSIPTDAIDVKIEIESCASTVRTNREEFKHNVKTNYELVKDANGKPMKDSNGEDIYRQVSTLDPVDLATTKEKPSNLTLSFQRTNSIQQLIPADKAYNVTLNYGGKNKMLDSNGQFTVPTGTCGPWVEGAGDWDMAAVGSSCANSIGSSYCANAPQKQQDADGTFWLCNKEKFGTNDTYVSSGLKDKLEKYRYNKIHISYRLPEVKPDPKKEEVKPEFDPNNLPDTHRLAYIQARPHIQCLMPVLHYDRYQYLSEQMEDSWDNFTQFMSQVQFSVPQGGGSGGDGHSVKGLCAAYGG